MTLWYGEPWPSAEERAPVCADDADRVSTPVGKDCANCLNTGEERRIGPDDRGVIIPFYSDGGWEPRPIHLGCLLHAIGAVGADGWPKGGLGRTPSGYPDNRRGEAPPEGGPR